MHRQFICKWAGNCNLFFLVLFCASICLAQQKKVQLFPKRPFTSANAELEWAHYDSLALKAAQDDRTNGISYIISGSIALIGGIAGNGVTSDPLEKGVYALFQTIGVASIGYGAYKWQVGDENRLLMTSLKNTAELSETQRLAFLKNYAEQKKETEKRERYIRAVTHGLIAALNFYNASQQKQDGVKNTLTFVGGANMLAAISYSF